MELTLNKYIWYLFIFISHFLWLDNKNVPVQIYKILLQKRISNSKSKIDILLHNICTWLDTIDGATNDINYQRLRLIHKYDMLSHIFSVCFTFIFIKKRLNEVC